MTVMGEMRIKMMMLLGLSFFVFSPFFLITHLYLFLVPEKDKTSEREERGAITKTERELPGLRMAVGWVGWSMELKKL